MLTYKLTLAVIDNHAIITDTEKLNNNEGFKGDAWLFLRKENRLDLLGYESSKVQKTEWLALTSSSPSSISCCIAALQKSSWARGKCWE